MIHDLLIAPFEDAAMRRALAGCIALALGGAPIGVFLVLRRTALIGDALSHAILPGVAIAFVFAGFSLLWMTIGGLAAGLAVALLAGAASRLTPVAEDASLAAFFIISLALGTLLVATFGTDEELLHVLFGDLLDIAPAALLTMAAISTATMATLALVYRPLIAECFDPSFLRASGHAGAIVHARVSRLVFGATDPKGGAAVSLYRVLEDDRLNHRVEVAGGVLAAECGEILSRFFREKRL